MIPSARVRPGAHHTALEGKLGKSIDLDAEHYAINVPGEIWVLLGTNFCPLSGEEPEVGPTNCLTTSLSLLSGDDAEVSPRCPMRRK